MTGAFYLSDGNFRFNLLIDLHWKCFCIFLYLHFIFMQRRKFVLGVQSAITPTVYGPRGVIKVKKWIPILRIFYGQRGGIGFEV